MKKFYTRTKIIALIAISIFCFVGFKSNAQIKKEGKNYTVEFSQTRGNAMNLLFTVGDYKITEKTINGVTYSYLNIAGGALTYNKGYAELPILNASVQLSPDKNVTLEVENGNYTDYNLKYPLLPSRGLIKRSKDLSKVPYEIDPASVVDQWYPINTASMVEPFIIRDVRGTNVYVNPIQYNAAKKILRVYKTINVKLVENSTNPVNPLTNYRKKVACEMYDLYQSMFINFNTKAAWPNETGEMGDILVVCTARDSSVINPYILWKKQMGFKVTKQVVATGTNIVTTVKNAYTANTNLLYVLLVGGWSDLKCNTSTGTTPTGGPMDPMVGCVVGTDNYPDIYIGRFSVSGSADVTTQVNKTVSYEKTPTVGGTWYKSALFVADASGGAGDDNETDQQHMDNIWTGRYSNFTFSTKDTDYEPNENAATITTDVNAGVGVINYAGDGDVNMWYQPNFTNTQVNALTNGSKLPFIISVACLTGSFHTTTCFGDAWLRKSGGGSVDALMSTVEQDWNQPMIGQDYMADILVGGYNYALGTATYHPDHGKTHFGSITFNGKALMLAEDATSLASEMQCWMIFGDPSLQVRTDTPKNITLSDSTVTTSSFTTNVKVNGTVFANALVSIWDGKSQPFSGLTDASGNVTITHTLASGTAVTLTVTGFNLYPKIINTTIANLNAIPTCDIFSNSVSVFPNPASKRITLSIDNSFNGNYKIEIINLVGQVVFTDVVEKNNFSVTKNIDLSSFTKGAYLLRYSNNGNVGFKKLILN